MAQILAALDPIVQQMVANKVDGALSDHEDAVTRSVGEPSSHMNVERERSVDGDLLSADLGESQIFTASSNKDALSDQRSHARSSKVSPSHDSRKPRYAIRVVPPRHNESTDLKIRPETFRLPGSYRTDLDTNVTRSARQTHEHNDKGHDLGILDLEDRLATVVEPSASATRILDDVREHNVRTLAVPTKRLVADDAQPVEQQKSLWTHQAVPSRSSSLLTVYLDDVELPGAPTAPLLPRLTSPAAPTELPDKPFRVSPVSRALSMLSEISSRSGARRESSISITTAQRRGSAVKPLGIACEPSRLVHVSRTNTENRENYQQPSWVQQLAGKRTRTSGQLSNLTARSGRHKNGGHKKREQSQSLTEPLISEKIPASPDLRAKDIDERLLLERRRDIDEPFAKVINDLETLLKEALSMAGNVASKDVSEALANAVPAKDFKLYAGVQSTETAGDSSTETSVSVDINGEEVRRDERVSGSIDTSELSSKSKKHHGFTRIHDATPYPARSGATTRHQSTATPVAHSIPDGLMEMDETGDVAVSAEPLVDYHQIGDAKQHLQPFKSRDWAYHRRPNNTIRQGPQRPHATQPMLQENRRLLARHEGMHGQQRPPITHSGVNSRKLQEVHVPKQEELSLPDNIPSSGLSDSDGSPSVADNQNSARQYYPVVLESVAGDIKEASSSGPYPYRPREEPLASRRAKETLTASSARNDRVGEDAVQRDYTLKDTHHFSIHEPHGFSLSRSHRRKPIARDWSIGRKRFVAAVTCITTALMGLVLGIYAGEVPALQYALADEHHITILGNVVFFLGLASTTIFLWPLPLLHGRKPYTLTALVLLLPLQFTQALAVNRPRSPYAASYRVGVLLPRALSGLVMGLANINFMTTLLDLFGASLQSGNPHQEVVNENDVRRHGGGIGAWLGIWTWCSIMSIGLGFLIGAGVISSLNVSWGFWVTIILNVAVLLLNVMVPEVRRSPYRRSVAEVRTGTDISRRVARGEIKMHLESTGPKFWYEEVLAGYVLSIRMLKQPGFVVLALYQGWIYGQVVMVIMLLGALLSKYYDFHPQYVGLGVAVVPLAALLAVPFQQANVLSRASRHKQRTDSMTFEKRVTWTSHLLRRSIFMILLPFAGLAYTLSSNGSVHYLAPIFFAGLIGFLSNLAIAECNGLIMEAFDTSDLQPGMTGRPRRILPEEIRKKRTNFSCFPRVTAGFAIAQTIAFLIAAGATGWGGVIERQLGAQVATAVVAGVLLILTLMLIAVLWRFKTVQVIPSERFGTNILSGPEDEWKPIIIGNPSGTTRRMNLLEMGRLSRWTEIRRRNRLGSI